MVVKLFLLFCAYAMVMDYAHALLSGFFYIGYSYTPISLLSLLSICIVSPLWEEAAYRYGPLSIAKQLGPAYIQPIAVMVSLFFGWGHNLGISGIIYQGVFGLFLSYLYIERGYKQCVLLHSMWNLSCLLFFDNLYYY